MTTQQKQRGFSLIELIIYMGLVAVATVVFTNFLVDVTRSSARSKVGKDVQQNARYAVQRIVQEVRGASFLNVPSQDTLKLNAGDSFMLNGDTLEYNGIPITDTSVRVTQLVFTEDPSGTMVTIVLTVEQGNALAKIPERSSATLTSTATSRILAYQ